MAPSLDAGDRPLGSDDSAIEPIAIVGFDFQFPGGVCSEEAFWDMLMNGQIDPPTFGADRVSRQSHEGSNDTSKSFEGVHLIQADIAAFDAPFFAITSAEAASMDPQQRMLLQSTFRALENAGMPLNSIQGSETSVHIGCFTGDYNLIQSKDPDTMPPYHATGNASSMLANRVSWFFDLKGPSVLVDTACSSSLVALDQACQLLRYHETSIGIIGGCNLICTPESSITVNRMGFLSPDGLCHSFDERGNGYGRGEGIAVLILKRLTDALRDRDTIRAIVRATGTNQNGRTNTLTQPSQNAQAELLQETYRKGGLDLRKTRFIEAHGTGTAIGDPIEANAIEVALRSHHDEKTRVFIGATKANFGHLEACSGLAGVIKTILVLERGLIPPIAGLGCLNRRITPSKHLVFPTKPTSWPSIGLRRASVQSFGFGGSNAHVIMDDAVNYLAENSVPGDCHTMASPQLKEYDGKQRPPQLLVWSAPDRAGLERQISGFAKFFEHTQRFNKDASSKVQDLAYTLSERRSLFRWRVSAVATDKSHLSEMIGSIEAPNLSLRQERLVLVFTGQGAFWQGMGHGLMLYPKFRDTMVAIQRYLNEMGCKWSIFSIFEGSCANLEAHAETSQTACTALQIGLVELLRSFGVRPAIVVGHSSGEIAAAYAIGAFSARTAMSLAFHRGQLADSLKRSDPCEQSMMAVNLSEHETNKYLQRLEDGSHPLELNIACINSPGSVTIAGIKSHLHTLMKEFRRDGIFVRMLDVPVAYHTPQMSRISEAYEQAIRGVETNEAASKDITLISSVTGRSVSREQLQHPAYWVSNLQSPVQFHSAVSQIISSYAEELGQNQFDTSVMTFLEVGPHSTLQSPLKATLHENAKDRLTMRYNSLLRRKEPAVEWMMHTLGELHCTGHTVNIASVNHLEGIEQRRPQLLSQLPSYPFDNTNRYWEESRISRTTRMRKNSHHVLLGNSVSDWNDLEPRWSNKITPEMTSFVEDHKVNDMTVYPAAAMLAAVVQGAQQLSAGETISGFLLSDVRFVTALIFRSTTTAAEIELRLQSTGQERGQYSFRLYSHQSHSWELHCHGTLSIDYGDEKSPRDKVGSVSDFDMAEAMYGHVAQTARERLASATLYKSLFRLGYQYGPSYQLLDDVCYNGHAEATARIKRPPNFKRESEPINQPHVVHPAALDAMFELALVAASAGAQSQFPTIVPSGITSLWISDSGLTLANGNDIHMVAQTEREGTDGLIASATAFCRKTRIVLAEVHRLEGQAMTKKIENREHDASKYSNLCFDTISRPDIDLMGLGQLLDHCWQSEADEQSIVNVERDITAFMYRTLVETKARLKADQILPQKMHLRKYIEWMDNQVQLFHNGAHAEAYKRYTTTLQNESELHRIRDLAISSKMWRFYAAVADNLYDMLAGSLDPLELLFGQNYATDFYAEANKYGNCVAALKKYLELLAHKNPSLRIIEIGAGTGATTRAALEALTLTDTVSNRFAVYDFTDISPTLVAAAQDALGERYPAMRFRTYDVERSPEQQAFSGDYDVVIAASVLHATANVAETLQNVRGLLKKGGKLIFMEGVRPDHIKMGFGFGLLPGWWLGVEEYRKLSPSMTEKQWDTTLRDSRFSGVDLEFLDFKTEECHEVSVLVSTAIGDSTATTPVSHERLHIVTDLHNPIDVALANELLNELGTSEIDCSVTSLAAITAHTMPSVADSYIVLGGARSDQITHAVKDTYTGLRTLLVSAKAVLWVATKSDQSNEGPDYGLMHGLARTARTENSSSRIITLTLDKVEDGDQYKPSQVANISSVYNRMIQAQNHHDYEQEYTETDGLLYIDRIIETRNLNAQVARYVVGHEDRTQQIASNPPLQMVNAPKMDISRPIRFEEDILAGTRIRDDDIEIRVTAAGCSFRDTLSSTYARGSNALGLEVAGTVVQVGASSHSFHVGDSVLALALGTYRTRVRTKAKLVLPVPTGLSFAQAASIPLAFVTAYQALVDFARLKPRDRILITSACGGVGQAAIQLAQHIGAEIYGTVGNSQKAEYLKAHYGLPNERIMSTYEPSRWSKALRQDSARGFNVVLTSLSGTAKSAISACLAPYGRIVDISHDSHKQTTSFKVAKNVSSLSLDIASMIQDRPADLASALSKIGDLLMAKRIRPLDTTVFSPSNIHNALQTLSSGESSGKLVIDMARDDIVEASVRSTRRYVLSGDVTYVIAGGLGGLGRSTARWMASRGARALLLLSRGGAVSEDSQTLLTELRSQGVDVEAPACDISTADQLSAVLQMCRKSMPPIKGCVQAAMILKDTALENMSREVFNAPMDSKVKGSWNLHKALPQAMDFFVMLSSVAGIFGKGGQANYAAASTYQDALAAYRVRHGQNALSIDLGAMESEGYLARNREMLDRIVVTDSLQKIDQAAFHALLDYACDPANIGTRSQLIVGLGVPSTLRSQGQPIAEWMHRPMFRALHCIPHADTNLAISQLVETAQDVSLAERLRTVTEGGCLKNLVSDLLKKRLERVLPGTFSNEEEGAQAKLGVPLHVLGVDSLVAIELRNWFEKEMGADITSSEILGNMGVQEIAELALSRSRMTGRL